MLNSKLSENMLGGELTVNNSYTTGVSEFGHEMISPLFYGMQHSELYQGTFAAAKYTRELDVISDPIYFKLIEIKNARG